MIEDDEQKQKKKHQVVQCGICNVEVENWEEHEKSEQHQRYVNDPTLITKMMAESKTNLFRQMIGARPVRIKPRDQIDKTNADDLWNWHVSIRDSDTDMLALRENIIAILQLLRSKYGSSDYRTIHVKKIVESRDFTTQNLEDARYIIHAEAEGITHETDNVHGRWLKNLKDEKSED